jgi:carbohydrate-binding DOMON domain-containing protein
MHVCGHAHVFFVACKCIARQRLQQQLLSYTSANKHVSTTIMEEMFSMWSMPKCYNQDQLAGAVIPAWRQVQIPLL